MKSRRLLAAVVVTAGAVAVPVSVHAADGDKATGGGQVLLGSSGKRSTITFTAQQTGDAVKGQVNFIDRAAGAGQDQVHTKGTVTCITVTGNMAEIGGRLNNEESTPFFLRVVDKGEGANADNDVIEFDTMGEDADCEQNDASDRRFELELAKGNAQVHERRSSSSSRSKSSGASTSRSLSLLR